MGGLKPYDVIPASVATLVLLVALVMQLRRKEGLGGALAVVGLVILWLRMDFGAHTLVSGADHFLKVFPPPPIDSSAAGPFVREMTRIGMYDLIKGVEVIAGLMIVLNVFTPVALILEFPITVSIFWLSVVVVGVGRPVFTGWRELFLNAILLAAYAGYFLPMLDLKARQRPLWDPQDLAARLMGWRAAIERYGLLFMRVYLGGFNLISGLNYYAHLMSQPVPADPVGRAFMDSTQALGLFQLAKVVELVGGAMLICNISVPFALVLLFPVTANVLVMNVFASPLLHVKASGARNFAFHLLLIAGYARYYLPLLKPGALVRPIWRKDAL